MRTVADGLAYKANNFDWLRLFAAMLVLWSHSYPLTVSIGVATTTGEEGLTPTELLRRADDRLYQAKRDGRNRVAA